MPETPAPHHNHLLAAFPADAQDRLFPHLERVTLPLGKVLYESDDTALYVYFPTDSILSLVTQSGAAAEVSVVGNEGLVGLSLVIGGETSQSRAIVQGAGSAYRLKGALLKDEFERNFKMMVLLLHYTRYLLVQVAQPTACNRRHSIDQQLCHWLLLSMDREPGNELTMTQQFIANVLGVHRRDVTDATRKLKENGVIEFRRGQITVLDRPSLEQLSCACYAMIKNERETARQRVVPYLQPDSVQTRLSARSAWS